MQIRGVRRLKLNFCDYFGDAALRELALGTPAETLQDIVSSLIDSISHLIVDQISSFFVILVPKKTASNFDRSSLICVANFIFLGSQKVTLAVKNLWKKTIRIYRRSCLIPRSLMARFTG